MSALNQHSHARVHREFMTSGFPALLKSTGKLWIIEHNENRG